MRTIKATLGRKELAVAAGVNPETLRFYENEGLIEKPLRTENGYRCYSRATVEQIKLIQEVKGLGFTLKEIREMIGLRAKGSVSCQNSASIAKSKIEELDAKIASLKQIRKKLSVFLVRCQGMPQGQSCKAFSWAD